MKVKIKSIEVNRSAIRTLAEAQRKAIELTVEAVLADIVSRQVVPRDTGDLERSGFVEKVSDTVYKVIFTGPQARRWYFNVPNPKTGKVATFQKTKNPMAQDHWMDYYLDGEGQEWVINKYMSFLKQESRGIVTS